MGNGQLQLTEKSRIVTADASLRPLANVLAQEIDQTCNLRLDVADGPPTMPSK